MQKRGFHTKAEAEAALPARDHEVIEYHDRKLDLHLYMIRQKIRKRKKVKLKPVPVPCFRCGEIDRVMCFVSNCPRRNTK